MAQTNYLLKIQEKFQKLPFGQTLFSKLFVSKAPYFKSIKPKILVLEENFCQVFLPKRKAVYNHIGTVHAIAVCNALEMAMGAMAEASIPKHLRWIPKGMDVKYTAKAGSDIRCEATLPNNEWVEGDLPVTVKGYDEKDIVVVEGTINLWVSLKPEKNK